MEKALLSIDPHSEDGDLPKSSTRAKNLSGMVEPKFHLPPIGEVLTEKRCKLLAVIVMFQMRQFVDHNVIHGISWGFDQVGDQ
ncbi:MAG: hypothetical protein AAGC81_07900 [Pseudomonadota bacterium]